MIEVVFVSVTVVVSKRYLLFQIVYLGLFVVANIGLVVVVWLLLWCIVV